MEKEQIKDSQIAGDETSQAHPLSGTVGDTPIWTRIRLLLSYWQVFAWVFTLSLIVLIAAMIIGYLYLPVERESMVEFRLLFDGADKGQYPNGTPFSGGEIISTPILAAVYSANKLERYTGFDQFRGAFMISQTSTEMKVLEDDYRMRMSDYKLTVVDRERIEKNYQLKKQALSLSDYELRYFRGESIKEIPSSLVSKVIADILSTWAEDAYKKKGVTKYQLPIVTEQSLRKDLMKSDDYIVRMDITRICIERILANSKDIAEIPGADVMVAGDNGLTLPDLQARITDLQRFRVNSLIGRIRALGLSKDYDASLRYLQNQLFLAKVDCDAAAQRAEVIEKALRNYMQDKTLLAEVLTSPGNIQRGRAASGEGGAVLIPQLSESIFDRVIDLAAKNQDIKFRQELVKRSIAVAETAINKEKEIKYYQDLVTAFEKGKANLGSEAGRQFIADFDSQYNVIFEELVFLLNHFNELYNTLSARNLQPETSLYQMLTPVSTRTDVAISSSKVMLVALLYFLLIFVVTAAACIWHTRLKKSV